MRLQNALDRYEIQLEADGRSPHTRDQAGRHIRLLGQWLEAEERSMEVETVNHEVLADFLTSSLARNRPDGQPKKASSMNVLRSSLKGFFRYLFLARHVDRDPSRLVRQARCGRPLPRALSQADQQRLLEALATAKGRAAERDAVLFRLMLATGIRLGSALGLRVEDIDLDAGVIRLRHAKGDREQHVPIGEDIRQVLDSFSTGKEQSLLFTGVGDRPLSARQARKRFTVWRARAGIPTSASPHSLRHTFASNLYKRTRDLLRVQQALGHRSLLSTLVYTAIAGKEPQSVGRVPSDLEPI